MIDLVAESLLWSIFLAGGALIASFIIGTVMGVYSAWRRGSVFDSVMPPFLAFVGAFPYFFFGDGRALSFGFRVELVSHPSCL